VETLLTPSFTDDIYVAPISAANFRIFSPDSSIIIREGEEEEEEEERGRSKRGGTLSRAMNSARLNFSVRLNPRVRQSARKCLAIYHDETRRVDQRAVNSSRTRQCKCHTLIPGASDLY